MTKSRTCSYGCKPFAIGATANTALSYKVRAFKVVNGKKTYGPFSKVRKVKVKK